MARPTTLAGRKAVVQRPTQPSDAPSRRCNNCGVEKSSDDFYSRYDQRHLKMAVCKDCKREYARQYHAENKEDPQFKVKRRERRIQFKYGITSSEYDTMLAKQNGVCAGCGTDDTGRYDKFEIDHDHETGKVRGLLCGPCNRALGLLKDNADTAISLAAYLVQHEERQS